MNTLFKRFFSRILFFSLVVFLASFFQKHNSQSNIWIIGFSSSAHAVPPPRGAETDPIKANRKQRAEKIKREKARRDSINCYLTERKKLDDGGLNCIYKCPKGRTENNSIGPGFRCPTMMNVLRRE